MMTVTDNNGRLIKVFPARVEGPDPDGVGFEVSSLAAGTGRRVVTVWLDTAGVDALILALADARAESRVDPS